MSVYNNAERPYPLTYGDPHAESVHPMLKSLNQRNSPLGDAFFSQDNQELLQRMLREAVRRKTGYLIDRQSPEELMIVMRSVYAGEANNRPMSLQDEVRRLNYLVVSECLTVVSSSLAAYLAYLRDASRIKTPIPRGVNTSIKGSRQLQPQAWV